MKINLRSLIQAAMFRPKYIHVFLNHLFIIRKGIFNYVRHYAKIYGNGNVLDYGCGSKPYRELFDCNSYVGADVRISGHDHSNSEIDYYIESNSVPLPNEQFDFILCSEVLEHVDSLNDVLREIHRLLKRDGILLVTTPFIWREHEAPYDFRRLTSFGLVKSMEGAGFEIVDATKLGSASATLFQLFAEECNIMIKSRVLRILVHFLFFSIPMLILSIISELKNRDSALYLTHAMILRKVR